MDLRLGIWDLGFRLWGLDSKVSQSLRLGFVAAYLSLNTAKIVKSQEIRAGPLMQTCPETVCAHFAVTINTG